jgi:UDPglucose--hexose-1-phosphate uridylyltransferase
MGTPSDAPELRRDPIAGRWVVIAPDRGRRPSASPSEAPAPSADGPCPFCPGNERSTPPEVDARRDPGTAPDAPGWRTRVIPNKFAALRPAGASGPEAERSGIYERMEGVGAHEVIIESPEHETELSALPIARIAEVLEVCRDRARAHAADPRVRYVLPFKNYGAWAGASQEHSHTQLLATPVIPNVAQEELAECERRWSGTGSCSFCALIEHERAEGTRLVAEDESFVALAPFASRFAYETWILPLRHASSFESAGGGELRALAAILQRTLAAMRRALDRPCYNFLIHSAPARQTALPWYHWHVEIIPKLSLASGFEWGTGAYINAVPPEEAAERLRAPERAPAERPAS